MSTTSAAVGSFILFGMGFLASLLLLENVYLGPRRLARSAESWVAVPCTIVDIGVKVQSLPATSGGSRSGSAGYEPSVVYDYVVDGQSYQGNKFWFRNVLCNSREEAESALVGLEKGKPALCFADPKNPVHSVLNRGFSPGGGVLMLIPLAFTTITGLGMIGIPWAFWRSGRNRKQWRRSTDSTSIDGQSRAPR